MPGSIKLKSGQPNSLRGLGKKLYTNKNLYQHSIHHEVTCKFSNRSQSNIAVNFTVSEILPPPVSYKSIETELLTTCNFTIEIEISYFWRD